MAMPTSGCIAIIASPQTCGSIRTAVTSSASGSLSTLSIAAGKTGTPYGMREFYGYAPVTATLSVSPLGLDLNLNAQTCTINVTASVGNSWIAASPFSTWLTIGSGTGSGNGSFTISATYNGGFPRMDGVQVSSSAPTRTIEVNQEGFQ